MILSEGQFPSSWNTAFLILLHKDGVKDNPSNYRGISITSCLSKLFNSILNDRLIEYMKPKLTPYQFGFIKNKRTTDCLFILKTLISQYRKSKKRLYACFIDFRKAFDTIWRKALFFKLAKEGIGVKAYSLIKSMYTNTYFALKFRYGISKFIQSNLGLKQGDNLSPSLFNLFTNISRSSVFIIACTGVPKTLILYFSKILFIFI